MWSDLTRGDVLADGPEADGWLVLHVGRASVVAVDLVFWAVYRWRRCEDGVQVARAVREHRRHAIESQWMGYPITVCPPPDEVRAHLNRGATHAG